MSNQEVVAAIDLFDTSAPVAPTGITRIARVGGVLKQSTDGQAYAPIGSGGSAVTLDWIANILAFLQTNVPTANFNSCMWKSDFAGAALADDGPAQTFRISGGGAASKVNTTTGGVWQLTTGAGGQIAIEPLAGPTQVANNRQNVWAIYARAKIITTPLSDTWLFIADLAGAFDIFIGVYGGASTTKVACGYTDDVDFSHVVATAQNIDVNGGFHDFLYVADGTNLKAFYDLNATPIDSRAIQANLDTGGSFLTSFIKGPANTETIQLDKLAIFVAQP